MANEDGFECRIYNTYQKEYTYAADALPFDEERRSVFSWIPGNHDKMCVWKFIPYDDDYKHERKFYIYNVYQNEYLYAADHAPFSPDRRHVFTWRNGQRDAMCVWRIEPTEKACEYALYNIYQKEYMYAADNDPVDEQRRRVFTWRPKVRPGPDGHYKLEWLGKNPLDE